MPPTQPTSFRLSPECRATISAIAEKLRLSDAAVIELAIQQLANIGLPNLLHGQDPIWQARAVEAVERLQQEAARKPGKKK
jgi:hypothetical protein